MGVVEWNLLEKGSRYDDVCKKDLRTRKNFIGEEIKPEFTGPSVHATSNIMLDN